MLVVGLLAGVILIGLGYAGAGRFIRYVPVPVVEGFTVGIAVIIALQQVPAALGADVHAEKVLVLATRAARAWVADPDWVPLGIAGGVIALVLLLSRFVPAAARFPDRRGRGDGRELRASAGVRRRSATSRAACRTPRSRRFRWATSTHCSCRPSPWPHWQRWRACCRRQSRTR